MEFLSTTLPSLVENLALDEALLEELETSEQPRETLRMWEVDAYAVVLGRASKSQQETNFDECQALGIPLLRRCSGGCAVLVGPGCLLYSVTLNVELRPELQSITQAHAFVLERIARALAAELPEIQTAGISDLIWSGRKFGGNSLRCKRRGLLYHGTILYDFDLPLISRCLARPPREPEYRAGRAHGDFVGNLPLTREVLLQKLPACFQAIKERKDLPQGRLAELIRSKYSRQEWHLER